MTTFRTRTLLTTGSALFILIASVLIAAQITILPGVLHSEQWETEREVRCTATFNGRPRLRGQRLSFGEGAAGTAALTGEPLLVDNYTGWSGRSAVPEATAPHAALLNVPLVWQDTTQGVLTVLYDRRSFNVDDQNLLRLLADKAAIVLETRGFLRK